MEAAIHEYPGSVSSATPSAGRTPTRQGQSEEAMLFDFLRFLVVSLKNRAGGLQTLIAGSIPAVASAPSSPQDLRNPLPH